MGETPLLREGLLSSPAFVRHLKSFLGLSEDVLLAISELDMLIRHLMNRSGGST